MNARLVGAVALSAMMAVGCGSKDNTAPDAPTSLMASWNDGTSAVDLSWTEPAEDAIGTLVIRSVGSSSADTPEDGTSYAVGDILPGGGVVVHAGAGTSASDANAPPGQATYTAFAFDGSENYSEASNDATVIVPIPAQTATLTIDTGAGTVTVSSPPPNFGLAASVELKPASYLASGEEEGELQFYAVASGAMGNGATITLTDGGDGATLAVNTVGTAVTVTYDQHTHTAFEIADLINNDASASAVMTVIAPVDGLRVNPFGPSTLIGGSDTDMRVWLSLSNDVDVTRPVHNAKAIVDSVSGGTAASRWTMPGGEALASFGYRGVDVGETSPEGWFDINGFGAAGPSLTVELTLADAPLAIFNGGWDESFVSGDPSGSDIDVQISSEATGFGGFDYDSRHREGFMMPDGRTMYLGNHNMPTVIGVDVLSLRPVVAADLTAVTDVGHVDSVVPSPDYQHLYAVVTYGAHAAFWEESGVNAASVCDRAAMCESTAERVDLVKLAIPSMMEVGRVTLTTDSQTGARGRKLSMTADGSQGVVPINREGMIHLVDLDAMTVTDTFDVTSVGTFCQFAAISPDGATTYVTFKEYTVSDTGGDIIETSDGTLTVIDNATGALSTLAPTTVAADNEPGFLEFGPNGLLYYGRKNVGGLGALSVYDPSGAGSWSEVASADNEAAGLEFSPDASLYYLYDHNDDTVAVHDAGDDSELIVAAMSESGFGHKMIVTPY